LLERNDRRTNDTRGTGGETGKRSQDEENGAIWSDEKAILATIQGE
jgi:hypothetical protein